jgi:hypothetical protein
MDCSAYVLQLSACGDSMAIGKGQISTTEFKKLLYEIRDGKPNVCVRLRRIGQMWAVNFMQVVDLNDKGCVLYDEVIEEFIHVKDLSEVMQFELDIRYMGYEPHFHYEVIPGNS